MNMSNVLILSCKSILKKEEEEALARDNVQVTTLTNYNQDMKTFKSYLDELESSDIIFLVYHFIADEGPETTSAPVVNFHEQMDYLKEAITFVSFIEMSRLTQVQVYVLLLLMMV